ncbi:MAG: flavin reductase family protein [Gammaproteobacteria bacterium]
MSIDNPVKQLFMTLTQGVYIVGVAKAGLHNAFTASSVMQVSLQPPMLAVAVNPANASYPLLIAGGIFSLTVLHRGQGDMADLFGTRSARDTDKLDRVAWHASPSGAPVLDEGVSYFDCLVVSKMPAGDHVLVLAEVSGGDFLREEAEPLHYAELDDLDGSDELMPRRLSGSTPRATH